MLFSDLKYSHADIAFIQETHFWDNKLPYLKNIFYPLTYHSTNKSAMSKGVSTLLSSKLPWTCRDTLVDMEGRIVFIKGLIGDIQLTLTTIYTPNDHQDIFNRRTLDLLVEFKEGQLILGGDFNIPLIPTMDTSSNTSSVPTGSHKRVAQAIHKAQLIDVWRLQHSGERDYIFYSSPHNVYTRIDFFLIPHCQLHAVHDSSIGSRTWSDLAPISLTYALSDINSFLEIERKPTTGTRST